MKQEVDITNKTTNIMKDLQLKQELVERIKKDKDLKNAIAYKLRKSPGAVSLWLRNNSHLLTTATCLAIISEELNTPVSKLTENKKLK